jgi:hypothetical protein
LASREQALEARFKVGFERSHRRVDRPLPWRSLGRYVGGRLMLTGFALAGSHGDLV